MLSLGYLGDHDDPMYAADSIGELRSIASRFNVSSFYIDQVETSLYEKIGEQEARSIHAVEDRVVDNTDGDILEMFGSFVDP